jgi:hypothetical protein
MNYNFKLEYEITGFTVKNHKPCKLEPPIKCYSFEQLEREKRYLRNLFNCKTMCFDINDYTGNDNAVNYY